jgi:hypothetical protein
MTRDEIEQKRADAQTAAHEAYDAALVSLRDRYNAEETKQRQALNVALAEAEAGYQRDLVTILP